MSSFSDMPSLKGPWVDYGCCCRVQSVDVDSGIEAMEVDEAEQRTPAKVPPAATLIMDI